MARCSILFKSRIWSNMRIVSFITRISPFWWRQKTSIAIGQWFYNIKSNVNSYRTIISLSTFGQWLLVSNSMSTAIAQKFFIKFDIKGFWTMITYINLNVNSFLTMITYIEFNFNSFWVMITYIEFSINIFWTIIALFQIHYERRPLHNVL